MVSRVEDRWLSKKKDENGQRIRRAGYGRGMRWMARWDDIDGRPRTKMFASKDHALAHLAAQTTKKATGTYVDGDAGNRFITDVIPEWAAASVHWKASTRVAAESDIRAHMLPYWGDWTVGAVRKRDVQEWVSGMKLAPRTVGTIHGRMLTFFGWCVDENLISKNPASKVNLPQGRAREHVFLTVEQVQALAGVIGDRYKPLVWLLASTGLRIGEAVELRVRDLELGRGRIRVERAVVFVRGGAPVVGPPKNGRARTVSVTPFLAGMLGEYVKGKRANDLVFIGPRGAQVRPNNFKRRDYDNAVAEVNAAAAQAFAATGKEGVSVPAGLWVHDLRHTAASWLIQSGASVKAVQRMLGHATAAITLDTYAGLFDQDLDDVALRMQDLLAA